MILFYIQVSFIFLWNYSTSRNKPTDRLYLALIVDYKFPPTKIMSRWLPLATPFFPHCWYLKFNSVQINAIIILLESTHIMRLFFFFLFSLCPSRRQLDDGFFEKFGAQLKENAETKAEQHEENLELRANYEEEDSTEEETISAADLQVDAHQVECNVSHKHTFPFTLFD